MGSMGVKDRDVDVNEEIAVIGKQLRRSIMALILDELEKVRRYWTYRFTRLVQLGLEASNDVNISVIGNRITLNISVEIPEKYFDKALEEQLRKMGTAKYRQLAWGKEMKAEEELKEYEENVDIEEGGLHEGDTNIRAGKGMEPTRKD